MFICVVCKEKFDNFYKDKDYDSTCKYCVEFEVHNESLKQENSKWRKNCIEVDFEQEV